MQKHGAPLWFIVVSTMGDYVPACPKGLGYVGIKIIPCKNHPTVVAPRLFRVDHWGAAPPLWSSVAWNFAGLNCQNPSSGTMNCQCFSVKTVDASEILLNQLSLIVSPTHHRIFFKHPAKEVSWISSINRRNPRKWQEINLQRTHSLDMSTLSHLAMPGCHSFQRLVSKLRTMKFNNKKNVWFIDWCPSWTGWYARAQQTIKVKHNTSPYIYI